MQLGAYRHWRVLKTIPFQEDTENVDLVNRAGDLLVVQNRPGGSWQPATVTGYVRRGGELVTTLSAFSEHGVRVRKHRGRWIVQTFQCIGNLSHADQPRWPTFYEKVGGHWQRADQRYPELFRDAYATLRFRCKQFPRDEVLPAYLNWTRKLLNGERVGSPPKEKQDV